MTPKYIDILSNYQAHQRGGQIRADLSSCEFLKTMVVLADLAPNICREETGQEPALVYPVETKKRA